MRLNANEKPLQVTHNLQVSDGDRGESMTLLRDQIVIQVLIFHFMHSRPIIYSIIGLMICFSCKPPQTGDEVNGMVMVRSADNRQGYCPVKYLQEV